MARPPARRPGADKPKPDSSGFPVDESESTDAEIAEVDDEVAAVDEVDGDVADVDEGDARRTSQVEAFWKRVEIDPVEIALPGGVGYTLRAYRMDTDVTPSDYSGREDLEFPDRARAYANELDDEEFDGVDDLDDEASDEEDLELEEDAEALADDEDDDADDDDDDDALAAAEAADEEVPLFLSRPRPVAALPLAPWPRRVPAVRRGA